jgi:mono/diheme cytochrome c family protein
LKGTAAAVLGLGALLAVAGCGTGGVAAGGDTTNGKTLFLKGEPIKNTKPVRYKAACGGCHTLADAGSIGNVGPNLDDAFAFARKAANEGDRFKESTIENVVLDQIRFPSKNNLDPKYVMPANLVTGQNADDVAAYVASVAAKTS